MNKKMNIVAVIVAIFLAGCSTTKSVEGTAQPVVTTSAPVPTTATTVNAVDLAMTPSCISTKNAVASLWDTIKESKEKAQLGSVAHSPLIKSALVASMKEAIKTTKMFVAICHNIFPDETAVYNSSLPGMMQELEKLDS